MFTYFSQKWAAWPYKGRTLIALIILIFILIGLTLSRRPAAKPQEAAEVLPEVQVQTLKQISSTATIRTTTSLELSGAAPLIARTGGRVTAIRATLGTSVAQGQTIVEIDGGTEANIAAVQTENAQKSLAIFSDIEKQTTASLDNAVAIAQNTYNSARTGKAISAQVQQKNQQLAENAVDQARLGREQRIAGDDDLLIRSANISVQAAKLAQDQAQLAKTLAQQQTGDAVLQAQRGLAAAQLSRSQTLATLASQKEAIEAQSRIAAEQIRLMQVTAPLSGTVSRLSVHVGDYITPGSTVGEVARQGSGATLTVFVPGSVRSSVRVGQHITMMVDGQEKVGTISALASAPSAASSLWQIDIATKEALLPNSSVDVSLPIASATAGTLFVPLDALNVREAGVVLLTVGDDGVIHEHAFTPIHYYNDFVEGTAVLADTDKIVVHGNRVLREGDSVNITGA